MRDTKESTLEKLSDARDLEILFRDAYLAAEAQRYLASHCTLCSTKSKHSYKKRPFCCDCLEEVLSALGKPRRSHIGCLTKEN